LILINRIRTPRLIDEGCSVVISPPPLVVDQDRFYRSEEKIHKKFEARNSKHETNPKSEFPMFKIRDVPKVYP